MIITSTRKAFIGGFTVFLLALIGALFIGDIYSDTEARVLVEAMSPSLRTLCFAIITASTTVVSLLLTTVGFAHRIKNDFDPHFYQEIKLIAQLCTFLLILAVLTLLALTMPITESDNLRSWFSVVYYVLIISSAILSALIVSTIIVLYETIKNIIRVVYPDDNNDA